MTTTLTRTIRTTTKEKQMTTTTLTRPRAVAVLDIEVDGPPTDVRTPDMSENGYDYWIGPNATVACEAGTDLDGMVGMLERAGWMARTGAKPVEVGLFVYPHNPEVPKGPLMRNGTGFTLWEYARETILTSTEA